MLYAGLAVWFAAVSGTLALLWRYKLTAGPLPDAPDQWPASSAISFAPGVANVVMFAHPQCPCTRASMTELARLSDELHGRAKVHVVLLHPADADAEFVDGAIRDRAVALGADLVVDVDGREAPRFGAGVSGSTLVYAADRALVFRGGITIARGHEGHGPAHDRDCAGRPPRRRHRTDLRLLARRRGEPGTTEADLDERAEELFRCAPSVTRFRGLARGTCIENHALEENSHVDSTSSARDRTRDHRLW